MRDSQNFFVFFRMKKNPWPLSLLYSNQFKNTTPKTLKISQISTFTLDKNNYFAIADNQNEELVILNEKLEISGKIILRLSNNKIVSKKGITFLRFCDKTGTLIVIKGGDGECGAVGLFRLLKNGQKEPEASTNYDSPCNFKFYLTPDPDCYIVNKTNIITAQAIKYIDNSNKNLVSPSSATG